MTTGRRSQWRTLAVVASVVVSGGSLAPAPASLPESCALVYPVATTCSYVATQVASFAGTGPFHLRVSFTDSSGQTRLRYDLDQPAGLTTSAGTVDLHQIGIGDTVEARVLGAGGVLLIGNPGAVPHSGRPGPSEAPRLSGDTTPVHDPAIAASGGWFYLASTGPGIPIRRSRNLRHWERAGQVFAGALPAWAPQAVPGSQEPWAPDLSFFSGRWHLYYVISTFGSKRAVIGLATNTTLDPADPAYAWKDEGPVLESRDLTDLSGVPSDYVALDPNVILDGTGAPHLVFGSFYGGLKLVDLDATTGRPIQSLAPVPLAANVQEYTGVEAGYMIARGGWYYLFASYDYCCRGTDSTYNVRVGRARSIHGPFVDDLGIPMLAGGGRYVLTSHGDMRGPGHNAVLRRGDRYDLVFHWYDAANNGMPTLGVMPLRWTADGWPTI